MKAILMFKETPKDCTHCLCCDDETWWCNADEEERRGDMKERPEWCPLIEINDNIARLIEVAR